MYYRLYQVNNSKKSAVRGYWTDNGKIYADNIHIKRYSNKKDLAKDINGLFDNGEKAVFYNHKGKGYIQNNTGKVDILKHRRVYRRKRLSGQEVKGLLKQYGGLTIYKRSSGYNIEVYHNYNIGGQK